MYDVPNTSTFQDDSNCSLPNQNIYMDRKEGSSIYSVIVLSCIFLYKNRRCVTWKQITHGGVAMYFKMPVEEETYSADLAVYLSAYQFCVYERRTYM